jgi:hypothetical protein
MIYDIYDMINVCEESKRGSRFRVRHVSYFNFYVRCVWVFKESLKVFYKRAFLIT